MADHAGWAGLTLSERAATAPRTPPLVYAQAAGSMLVGAVAMTLLLRTFGPDLDVGRNALWLSMVIYGLISGLALLKLPTYPHSRFGPANIVTTLRAAATAMVGGIILGAEQLTGASTLWFIAGSAATSLALDGLDGYLARRSGTSSRYGARYDMEVDALLILLLATAVALLGKGGIWVLLIGLMRYGFLAARTVYPGLSGELPESMRRKIVCVVQGAALCVALAPIVSPLVAQVIVATALLSLIYSFAVDIAYLLKQAKGDTRVA